MVNIIKTVFGTLKEEENNMITTLNLKEPLILTSSTLKKRWNTNTFTKQGNLHWDFKLDTCKGSSRRKNGHQYP